MARSRWWRALGLGLGLMASQIACTNYMASGYYQPLPSPRVATEFPVVLREVGIERIYSMGGKIWDEQAEWLIRDQLKAALAQDLYASGPFRKPRIGEPAYKLDIWIEGLGHYPQNRYSATVIPGLLLAFVPYLVGMPMALTKRSGSAEFQLHAPAGELVLEASVTRTDKLYEGVYRNHGLQTIGMAAAPIVQEFKRIVVEGRQQILAGKAIQPHYVPDEDMRAALKRPAPPPLPAAEPPPDAPPDAVASLPTTPAATPSPPVASRPPVAAPSPPVTSAPVVTAGPQPSTFVLAIGIDRYRDAPRAEGAEADARRIDALFAQTFRVPAHHRRLLLGDRATRSDIEQGLRWLAEQSRAGARVVVYFSGHGTPDADSGEPRLVPFEADPERLAAMSLPLVDVEARLASITAREAVLIVDACFSGQGARSIAPKGARPLVRVERPTRVIRLAAAAASQSASATPDGSGGLFTRYLLTALGEAKADGDGDGQITLAELDRWLTPRVSAAAQARGRTQTPSLISPRGDAEEIVLGWGYPID